MSNQSGKGNWAINLLWVVAILLIVVPAVWLGRIFWGYHEADSAYSAVAKQATSQIEVATSEGTQYSLLEIDWDQLRTENPEVVGWIQMDDLENVNYPIVRAEDDSYYLTHSFACSTSKSGAIFMETQNAGGFSDLYTIIYGHNMKNGSMFGSLKKYANKDFCSQGKNGFTLYTPEGIWRYQIFSVEYAAPDAAGVYTIGQAAGTDYLTFLQAMQKRSLYDFGVTLGQDTRTITLSTCSGEEMRFVVHAACTEQLALPENG